MVSAKRRSCKTQLILTVEDLTGEINKGSQTNVILLDSLEAVDKILYKHLLLMLDFYGIRSKIKRWIEDFSSTEPSRW